MRNPRWMIWAVVVVLGAVLAGCSRSTTQVESGGPGTTAASTTPATATPTTAPPTTTSSSLPANCHSAPASTAVGVPGGGEIVCETVPGSDDGGGQSTPGFPGSGETLVPVTTIPDLQPTATQGVLRVSVSGTPCSASRPNDPCPAIAEIVQGTLVINMVGERAEALVASIPIGRGDPVAASTPTTRLVAPGPYRVTVLPDGANRVCTSVKTTVTAGQVTEAAVTCAAP